MRIIDKQHDYYDYLQNSTDTLVFDRRGSYVLTKNRFIDFISFPSYKNSDYRFIVVQCGATFWLLLVHITEYDRDKYSTLDRVKNYTIEILDTWKNYNKPNKLLKIDMIHFHNMYKIYNHSIKNFEYDKIKSNIKDFVNAIDQNDIIIDYHICDGTNIPLLKACGIGNCIDATSMFCAIEEYFSIEKTNSETTEAKGITNDDKIIMHGFDTKISFRGK